MKLRADLPKQLEKLEKLIIRDKLDKATRLYKKIIEEYKELPGIDESEYYSKIVSLYKELTDKLEIEMLEDDIADLKSKKKR